MPERVWAAKPVIVEYLCDACGQGGMVRDGKPPDVFGEQVSYGHVCNACGVHQYFGHAFPWVKHVCVNKWPDGDPHLVGNVHLMDLSRSEK